MIFVWLATPSLACANVLEDQKKFIAELCLSPDKGGELIKKGISGQLSAKKNLYLAKLAAKIGITYESEKWKGLLPLLPKDRKEDRSDYRVCVANLTPYIVGKEIYEQKFTEIRKDIDKYYAELLKNIQQNYGETSRIGDDVSLIREIISDDSERLRVIESQINKIISMQRQEYKPFGFGVAYVPITSYADKIGGKALGGRAGRVMYDPPKWRLGFFVEYGEVAWKETRSFPTFPGVENTPYEENNNHDYFIGGGSWYFYKGEYLRPYAGLAWGRIKSDVDNLSEDNEDVMAAFGGVRWTFSKYFSLFTEFRYTKTNLYEKRYKFEPFGESNPEYVSTPYSFYSAILGLSVHF